MGEERGVEERGRGKWEKSRGVGGVEKMMRKVRGNGWR